MIFFKIITIVLTFKGAMAERFYNVVTSTTSFVDNYQESPATALFCFKQQFVSTLGSCAILCTKEKDHPCEGFTLTIENETGRFLCNLGKGKKNDEDWWMGSAKYYFKKRKHELKLL